MSEDDFEPMPQDWTRALAVVAHPDDLEYGCASAIAAWTEVGREVTYLLVTRGEAGIDGMNPTECAALREREQRASAEVVGVRQVEFLDYPDGVLEYGLPLRRDIAAAIRGYRPELVITTNHRETWPGGFLNMADHRVVGQATLDAVRDAGNRWVFTEQVDDGLLPWQGVRWVAASASPYSTHAVDVSRTVDRGVASLREHAGYLAGLGDSPMGAPEDFLPAMARESGKRFGGVPACDFELFAM